MTQVEKALQGLGILSGREFSQLEFSRCKMILHPEASPEGTSNEIEPPYKPLGIHTLSPKDIVRMYKDGSTIDQIAGFAYSRKLFKRRAYARRHVEKVVYGYLMGQE